LIIVIFEKAQFFSPKIAENCDHNIDPRFVLEEQKKYPEAHGDLSQLLTSIQSAVKVSLRPIINLAPRSKLSPPGAKLSPRGEFCLLWVKLSPGDENLCCPPFF
jgi:hypothetical protein